MDSGCSFNIITRSLMIKPKTKKYSVMQWHTQAINITTNMKVKIDFTSPEFNATKK